MAAATDPENTLILETTKGRVVIALRPDLAPGHVERIKKLAREGFYNGRPFHRVIEGFMAQTGCPHGTGTGGSKYPNLKAEFNAEPHVRGVCSMARSQSPDSANSQFFIVFDDATFLDKKYTVWGKVIEGMENVDKIKRGEPVQRPRQDRLHEGRGRRARKERADDAGGGGNRDLCGARRRCRRGARGHGRARRGLRRADAAGAFPAHARCRRAGGRCARDPRRASGRLSGCCADPARRRLALQRRHHRAHAPAAIVCFPWRRRSAARP